MPSLASHRHIRAERNRFRRAQDGRAWSVKDLPKFYYHKNFSDILSGLRQDLALLLDPQSLAFIHAFENLPFAAQCAYVRLCGRKGRVFDIARLDYPEIPSLSEQFDCLSQAKFVHTVTSNDTPDYFSTLPKTELTHLMSAHLCPTAFKKSWKKDRLLSIAKDKIKFEDLKISENVWVQGRTRTLDYLLYLHSGRIENGLQNLALRDMGLVKTPKSNRKYGERFESLESARSAWFYARRLQTARKQSDNELTNTDHTIDNWPVAQCARSQIDRDKLLHQIGRAFERQNRLDGALGVYAHADSELCNERVIRLRYKEGDIDWVQSRLEQIIDNPISDNEHTFAQDFYARKFHKKRTSSVTDMLRSAETITLDEAFKHQPEKAAAQYLKSQDVTVFRSENRPWRTLFGLLFWDELFPEIHGTTLNPSLLNGCFYSENKNMIETTLAELSSPHLIMIKLLKTLTTHYGIRQRVFRWGSRDLDRIQALIQTAPQPALANMLRLMTQNWQDTKDGFPDLMVIENDECRFVEVKSQGDVIRRNQLTRLKQLKKAGFQASILQINWAIDPNQTYVVVDVETTGGRPGLHRVTEIGAVKIRGGKIIEEWSSLINPQRSIPAHITRLTGISQQMVANAPVFAEIVDSFETFTGDAIFAAHNVNFDYGFISAEFQMVDRRFRHPKICTCASMRKLYPGHRSYSLKNLCRDFNISLESHHRALCDAKAAAELLFLVNDRRLENQQLTDA